MIEMPFGVGLFPRNESCYASVEVLDSTCEWACALLFV